MKEVIPSMHLSQNMHHLLRRVRLQNIVKWKFFKKIMILMTVSLEKERTEYAMSKTGNVMSGKHNVQEVKNM